MLSKNSNSKIEYPAAGNFPLVDFFMKSPTETVSVSSKAGSSTGNTIKVQHVLTNADKLKVKIKPELRNILNVIATSSVTDMPLDAADVINTPELKKLKLVYKKDPSGLNLYKLESAVIKYVNDKFGSEMQDIVLKSIGDMVYVKTKINHSLGADFAVKHPSEGLNFKLRSKNSQNRWKDRVGFNVK